MLLARDAGPAPAPGNMAALPGDSNPGPAPLCPEAKKAALCIPTIGNVVVVVVVDIGSWVLPLSLNCSLVRQPLDLPSEVLQ